MLYQHDFIADIMINTNIISLIIITQVIVFIFSPPSSSSLTGEGREKEVDITADIMINTLVSI